MTISFDPERDTPDVLKAYAESVGADPAIWQFTTLADPAMMKFVIGGGFETYYEPNEDGSFSFDPAFVLVDGWGIIRGEYRYQTMDSDTERILRHLGVLAEEVINSQGANSVAYEAAHYFLCYAP
jgi:protein SCO1/2